jgi:hypothetical protein
MIVMGYLFCVYRDDCCYMQRWTSYFFYFDDWDVEWLMLFNITVTHELEYSNLVTLIWRVRCIFNLFPRCGKPTSRYTVVMNLGRKFSKYNPH